MRFLTIFIWALMVSSYADSQAVPSNAEPYIVPRIFLEPKPRSALPPGVKLRKVYDKGIELTASMEGYRKHLYDDPAGYCTIGYGHLVKHANCDGTEPARFRQGLDNAAAMDLLREDMALAERAVMSLAKVELTDGQYAALCDFTYNVGRGALSNSTLLKYLNAGEYHKVPAQLLRYVYAGGNKLAGLERRRKREINLYWEGMIVTRAVPGPDEDLTPIDILTGLPVLKSPVSPKLR